MKALATTEMAQDTLENLLKQEPAREPWEVGEALAECILEQESGIVWPWNSERDKRTPKASLPGADLVGFVDIGADTFLALGEVKTSFDKKNPPGVMTGRTGMIYQMDQLAASPHIHLSLLKWLDARCKNTSHWPMYQRAASQYLQSQGRAIMLFGMLMRDTPPHEDDLKNRAISLAQTVLAPTKVELAAWYAPHLVNDWVKLAGGPK